MQVLYIVCIYVNSLLELYTVLIKLCVNVNFWHSRSPSIRWTPLHYRTDTPFHTEDTKLYTFPTYTIRVHFKWRNFTWVSVLISFDCTQEHKKKFSWGSSARALKTLSRLRQNNSNLQSYLRLTASIVYPTPDQKWKGCVLFQYSCYYNNYFVLEYTKTDLVWV